jgi:hypothetical protein
MKVVFSFILTLLIETIYHLHNEILLIKRVHIPSFTYQHFLSLLVYFQMYQAVF